MRLRTYAAVFLLAAFSAVGIYLALTKWWLPLQKENDAREQLAFVSIVDRLPKGKPITPSKPLDAEAKMRWQRMETELAGAHYRADLLKALHEKTRRFFVESPGAGSGRGVPVMPEDILLDNRQRLDDDQRRRNRQGNADPLQQPGPRADFPVSAGEALTSVQPDGEFHFYHERGVWDFLYPQGFGYLKDRHQVAGFKSHGFRNLFVSEHETHRWRVQHVLLIGILTQSQPVVYLTDKLPSMEQIRQDKVRPLDFFEEAGMPSLRDGEDLYIVRKGDTLRMLGALRATKTCQKCHDAEIGDLLGAFSYTLRPTPRAKKGDSGNQP
jgi:hypothetical protein